MAAALRSGDLEEAEKSCRWRLVPLLLHQFPYYSLNVSDIKNILKLHVCLKIPRKQSELVFIVACVHVCVCVCCLELIIKYSYLAMGTFSLQSFLLPKISCYPDIKKDFFPRLQILDSVRQLIKEQTYPHILKKKNEIYQKNNFSVKF